MFSRKNHSPTVSPPIHQESPPSSPLPRLQQLTELESQLISILGKRNILIDETADIFTRLQQLYLHSLQGTPLGTETLEKCLRVVGGCDSPARVRFLYLCAHEMVLKGAAVDQVEPVLLDAFHSDLALKNKVDLGFKAGLAFCQVSEHSVEVDKVLSNLVVALEQELGYRPQRKTKAQSSNFVKNCPISTHSGMLQAKAIYLGRSTHKSASKSHPYGKAQRLELFKLLYQGFVTGSSRVQSQAKRRYYQQCKEELRGRLIREYPGRQIEKKLTFIDEKRSISLVQLGSFINWHKVQLVQERSSNNSKVYIRHSLQKSSQKMNTRSKSQATSSAGFQSLKNSFIKETQTPWGTSTPMRRTSFKLHIRRNSKHKLQSKKPTERQDQIPKQRQLIPQQPKPEITRLVFKESSENIRPPSSQGKQQQTKKPSQSTKGIVLKFDRLHHDKTQVKKKKLKCNFNWEKDKQKGQKQNNQQHVPHVFDIQLLPQIEEQTHQNTPKQQKRPQLTHFPQKILQKQVEQQHSFINHSISELNSAHRIDQLLKEGVQWIAHLQDQPYKVVSNAVLSQCQLIAPTKLQQSFSDTQLINECIQQEPEEASKDQSSYQIVIKSLEKPQVNSIISDEVGVFLKKMNESLTKRQSLKEKTKKYLKKSRKQQLKQRQAEVSIEMRKQGNDDSSCQKVEVSSKLQQIHQQQSQDKSQEEALAELSSGMMMLANQITSHLQEDALNYKDQVKYQEEIQVFPVIKVDYVDKFASVQQEQIVQTEVSQWFTHVQQEIIQNLQQQTHKQQQQIQNSQQKISNLPLSKLKCSIKAQNPSPPSSIDNKQISSQIKSCPSIQQAHLKVNPPPFQPTNHHLQEQPIEQQRPFNNFLAPFAQQRQGSQFTCSKFGGSKIDTEKQSDFQWRSQMNFMNEIFKNDGISQHDDPLPLLQIPQNRRDSRCIHIQQSSQIQNQNRSNHRSRTQSQISNKSNKSNKTMKQSASSRSLRKQKTHVCLSFSYTDNYESVTHTCKKFNHWLSPQLRVANHRLILAINNTKREKVKQVLLPEFVDVNDDTVREVSKKVELFLNKFPQKKELNEQQWTSVGKQLQNAELLPEQTELPFISIKTQTQQQEIRCVANLKSMRIVLQSTKLFLKINPITTHSLQELQTIVSALDPSKFCIKSTEILVKGMWTFTGQRNIKLRQKSQASVSHLIFDVLEKYNENDTFDYCIKESCGENLYFEGIQVGRRPRILKNMDTIIGFCLKTIEGKPKFINQNLKQFLTLF